MPTRIYIVPSNQCSHASWWRDEQLPCGGVSIYIKGVYHKPIQLTTHLQAVAVQVTLGSTPVNILSVYTPSSERLTTQDLSRLIRGLNGHILITADFNGHKYSWDSLSNDIRGDVVERFTNKNKLCIFNDGSPTYLKPQAQHSQNPTSAIDLPICTPDLALRCTWEVLPDTHGSDHYPVLISVSPTLADTDQGGDSNHWVFPKADWERFAESCMVKLQDISSKTKTLSHPLTNSSSVPQKTASQGQPQSQKSLTHGLKKSAERCWGPDGLLTGKSTEEGGLEQRHSCP